jgi:chromosome segregation ATPase
MDPNNQDPTIAVFSSQLQALHEDVTEIKEALSNLSAAITKLALVEERQTRASSAIERAFTGIDKLESRIAVLERDQNSDSTKLEGAAKWVDRAVVALVTGTLMFVAKHVGLI